MIMPSRTTVALCIAGMLTVAMPSAATADPAPDGEALFKQRCQGCHVITPGQTGYVAPNLAGVVGRKAASTNYSYSDALKASKLVWTRPNLDRFLSGPQQMVSGTRMVIKVGDPSERAAIIAFLAGTSR